MGKVHQPYRASTRAIYAWGVGNFGESMMVLTVSTLLMPVFNTGFGLSAVLVSWAISAPRLIDTFIDPWIGNLSDNTRTRWGRRCPYLLAGSCAAALFIILLWWPSRSWSEHGQFWYLLITCFLFWVSYSIFYIPLIALGVELTDDYHERTKITAIRIFFNQLGTVAVGWIYWLALRPVFGGEVPGMRWLAWLVAGVVVVTGVFMVRYCPERFHSTEAPKVKLWQSLRAAMSNRFFRRLLGIRIIVTLGFTLFASLNWYINTYYICGGDKAQGTKLMGLWSTIYALSTVALLPLATPISRRIGKKSGLVAGMGMMLVTSLALPVLQTQAVPYVEFIGTLLLAIATTLVLVFLSAFLPDVCDLDEVETGVRREGVYGSVVAFVSKLEASLCSLIVGYIITWVGFNHDLLQQPADVLFKLRWATYIPFILCSSFGLYFAARFPLTENIMKITRETLDGRRS